MKNRLPVLVSLIIICLNVLPKLCVAQTYDWVKGGGTISTSSTVAIRPEEVHYMCTDPNGNMYAVSQVGNDPIYADTFHRSSGTYGADENIMLTSYNCEGQMRWAKLIASSGGACFSNGIIADSMGHVYLAGYLPTGALHIGYDTTLSTYIWGSTGLISFDTSGHFNWIKYLGNLTPASGYAAAAINAPLALDMANNVHMFAGIGSGAVLMPGVTSVYGCYDITFTPAGVVTSAKRFQLDSSLEITAVALDKQTNQVYAVGGLNQAFSDSAQRSFVAAFDTARNIIWKDSVYSPGFSESGLINSVILDNNKHLYFAGAGVGTAIFRNDTIRNELTPSVPNYVSYILKTDTAGNPIWTRSFSCTTSVNGLGSITFLGPNKVAAGGVVGGEIAGNGDTIFSYAGEGQNAFFVVVDTAGFVHSVNQLHGDGFYDGILALTADKTGNLYVGGKVGDSIYGGSITPYVSVGGASDFFYMKYGIDCGCTSMPVANYTASSGTATVTFTYTGTTTSIDSVRWYFGDGGTSTAYNPTHTYTTPGTFTACVTVYSHCGNDEHCSNIVIPCLAAPVASYTFSGTPATTFTYTGTTAGVDSIRWHFGDGATSSVTSPVHAYTAIGTYTACVIAYSQCGNDTVCNTINIPCLSAPTAAYTESGISPAVFNYVGTTTGVDSITWTFGDTYTATGTATSHTYSSPGSFTACVTAHSACGNNTSCSTISIPCITAPVAAFTESGTSVSSFTYTGTTVGLDSVHWDFGDGGASSGTTTTHGYSMWGMYNVCVTAYNPCGSNTSCATISVPCVATPTASFTSSVSGHTLSCSFTGTTTYGVDSVVWYFGDGSYTNGITATHTYAVADTYHVCVVAYSQCGDDSSCSDVVITPPSSVTNITFADVQVYPNPATSELNISGLAANTQYRVLNVTGQALQTGTLKAGNNTLLIQQINSGVYLLELTTFDGIKQTFRFVKE